MIDSFSKYALRLNTCQTGIQFKHEEAHERLRRTNINFRVSSVSSTQKSFMDWRISRSSSVRSGASGSMFCIIGGQENAVGGGGERENNTGRRKGGRGKRFDNGPEVLDLGEDIVSLSHEGLLLVQETKIHFALLPLDFLFQLVQLRLNIPGFLHCSIVKRNQR
jgi:hypothetical protein